MFVIYLNYVLNHFHWNDKIIGNQKIIYIFELEIKNLTLKTENKGNISYMYEMIHLKSHSKNIS